MPFNETRRPQHLQLVQDNTALVLAELLPKPPPDPSNQANSYADFLARAGGDHDAAFAAYYNYVMEECVHAY